VSVTVWEMAATEAGARAVRSIEELYRQHVGAVYRYAYAVLGNHADAEDVTQTTFINALRSIEAGEIPRAPENWLLTIARNIVRQRWRQLQSRPAEVGLHHEVAGRELSDSHDDTPELTDVVRALQRIPPSQREALVLRELEGRSYQDIAALLDLTVGALETLLFRARRSLAEELENVVTCDRAEVAISRRLDSRLSRKERKRLDHHLAECAPCARLAKSQQRYRGALRGLAVIPLPVSLALFNGAPSASAAAGLPTIGAASAAGLTGSAAAGAGSAVVGAGVAGSATAAGGGALLGGVAAKAVAAVVAAAVAGGAGYTGVKQISGQDQPKRTPAEEVQPRSPGAGGAAAGQPESSTRSATRPEDTSPATSTPVSSAQSGEDVHQDSGGGRPAGDRPVTLAAERGGSAGATERANTRGDARGSGKRAVPVSGKASAVPAKHEAKPAKASPTSGKKSNAPKGSPLLGAGPSGGRGGADVARGRSAASEPTPVIPGRPPEPGSTAADDPSVGDATGASDPVTPASGPNPADTGIRGSDRSAKR
jgi:RNA polymerase sigma factor (sigma-70 family)